MATPRASARPRARRSRAVDPRLLSLEIRRQARPRYGAMITKHSHSTVYVIDQDRAKAFYTETLGFEVRDDVKMGDFRWLTVAPKTQPDACIVLMLLAPSPLMNDGQERKVRGILEAGRFGRGGSG